MEIHIVVFYALAGREDYEEVEMRGTMGMLKILNVRDAQYGLCTLPCTSK